MDKELNNNSNNASFNCPVPIGNYKKILLAHGSGGRLTNELIKNLFLPSFNSEILNQLHDGAVINLNSKKIAFTTDSYVVQPIFFPGGDIGKLAVYGTVNDLSVCGAKPLFISLSFIIEEGLPVEVLCKIVQSIKEASDECKVKVVTGDTKVVEKGKGDNIFINTSGIGEMYDGVEISPARCRNGDVVILNGFIAEHGMSIISSREDIGFETKIKSDCAPLNSLVEDILKATEDIHVMRDPTRGGLSSALNEIAEAGKCGIEIIEEKIPVSEEVKGACELLGFDPLYVANEGKILVFVPEKDSEKVLYAMKKNKYGEHSEIIGKVTNEFPGKVILKTSIGSRRIVDMLSGEQLPRIC
ncbi:MAG: hydrogenase expression/formation protein HypE [Ignavibacteriales bacterium]|nr:MAG: hydrogenase expression/formation protein HypE [Ignavibacteriales bacterium]